MAYSLIEARSAHDKAGQENKSHQRVRRKECCETERESGNGDDGDGDGDAKNQPQDMKNS